MHVEAGISEVVDAQLDTKSMGGVRIEGRIRKKNRRQTLNVLLIPPWQLGKRSMKRNNDTDRQRGKIHTRTV